MFDFLENSAFFGVAISVVSYGIGMLLKKKFKLAILNPLLISIVITIAFLARPESATRNMTRAQSTSTIC